jgi:electron transfer flavoprotein alpha subunit
VLRVAVLIKQVPKAEEFALDPAGRLRREGVDTEINAYCRRAISKGVELVKEHGGTCTVVTLGPPGAADALREALAWGADRGVHACDEAFAGSDTIATARAVVAVLQRLGEFDLVLTGRNSIDSDTAQVPPQLAEILGLPFVPAARRLEVSGATATAHCELDDGWLDVEVELPAVIACAERLCDPAKVKPDVCSQIPLERVERITAADLGPGPFGQAGSPTTVGEVRGHEIPRAKRSLTGPVAQQVMTAVEILQERGALGDRASTEPVEEVVPGPSGAPGGPAVVVLAAPDRARTTRELTGAAAGLAAEIAGSVVVIDAAGLGAPTLGGWGADEVVAIPAASEAATAAAVAGWCEARRPWAVLAPATMWGREVTGRLAARLGAGLTGDAVDLSVDHGRLLCWKPAFSGRLVAAIRTSSDIQLATVRPDSLPLRAPRPVTTAPVVTELDVAADDRLRVLARGRDDDIDLLLSAQVVIGLGTGVPPEDYPRLDALRALLDAELGATRKVTDRGWLPRARQIGLTGHSVAPRLYLAIGMAGKFNHMVGVRSATTVLAINSDPDAPVFDFADIGLVADWRAVVPALTRRLQAATALSL